MSRKIHMMPRRDVRIASGGSFFIANDTADGVTDYWVGYEAYTPGTSHVAASHRASISPETFAALRKDIQENAAAVAHSQPTVAERLAGNTSKSGPMQVRRPRKRLGKADTSLLTAVL